MADSRENILASLRRTLTGGTQARTLPSAVSERLAWPPRGPRLERAGGLIERFCERVTAAAATVETVSDGAGAITALLRYLDSQGLAREVITGDAPLLDGLPWPETLQRRRGRASGQEPTSVTAAYLGVAETGSLVMLAGRDNPTTLNFLPDNLIGVVEASSIVASMEDVWARLRAEARDMPRALNFVTGPSRTADIEQTIQLGAHGPRRMHVIVLRRA